MVVCVVKVAFRAFVLLCVGWECPPTRERKKQHPVSQTAAPVSPPPPSTSHQMATKQAGGLGPRLKAFMASPTGPRTTHFWGPVANWGFVLAVR